MSFLVFDYHTSVIYRHLFVWKSKRLDSTLFSVCALKKGIGNHEIF